MIDHEHADRFMDWAQRFAQKPVEGNEGEVETKFVLPLFEHLGYSEGCRRDKFYIKGASQNGEGTDRVGDKEGKAYPDFVYFSTLNRGEQNNDTALVVIEVKKPDENLDRHYAQALKYGKRLQPLFIVLTNGRRVKVLRLRTGGEESVQDVLVESFRNKEVCLRFYERMNFETVKRIKDLTVEDLQYDQFLQLDRIINADPELQDVLRSGDFKPHRAENELGLSITKKKVSVSCVLPTGQEEGGCHVEFSNPLRRKLGIHLPFREFRRNLMENLHTSPQWDTRKFLRRMSNMFEATLGPVTTTLSSVEAEELCECIDEIAERYKSRVIEEETLLETWNYEPIRIQGERAYKLITVSRPLWDLMKKFADEHDYGKGHSEWHNFVRSGAVIRVGRGPVDHVQLRPISDIGGTESLPNGYIHVLYNIPDWMYLEYDNFSYLNKGLWKESIGPNGIWTANYTKEWLLNKFIPRALEYYRKDPRVKSGNAFVSADSSPRILSLPYKTCKTPEDS